jgi:hypothetical protein
LIQKFADLYVSHLSAAPVGDVLLSWLPTVDIDFLIIQGALFLSLLILVLLLLKPKYITFTGKALAIFIIVRSISISLTHLGQDPHQIVYDTNSFGYGLYNILFNSKNDFFFSGHTGMPFLMSLIFWKERFWRDLFILLSLTMAVTVLLSHVHYSIDVFAAPFMTYAIFSIAKYLFPHDYVLVTKKT